MTAIPEDVRERAEALCHEICALFSIYDETGASFDYGTAESLIAALILSEREAAQREERARCAAIVTGYTYEVDPEWAAQHMLEADQDADRNRLLRTIAAAILQEPNP